MSSSLKDILGSIEQLEKYFDEYHQAFQKNSENIIQNLSSTWKLMKLEHNDLQIIEENIEIQKSELTGLKIKSDDFNKKIESLKSTKDELLSKDSELKGTLERINDDLMTPKVELENLLSKLNTINEKIASKELEKSELDQKKIDNENRENQLKTTYTEQKMEDLNKKLTHLKRDNYFTSFLIENSKEEIPEVDIIATIITQGSCNLDELKKLLDVPPIMAVRTIKQLAVKSIIKLDEDTNIITMP
jgi:chromosome segregation ATPase